MTLYPRGSEAPEGLLAMSELSTEVTNALWDTNGLDQLGIPQNGSIVKSLSPDQARYILGEHAA